MKIYRFSPIENKSQLLEAIKYTHLKCFDLCKKIYGKYLPVAGNIGIFCHYDDEYNFLTKLREELTEESDNWNNKYYRLHEPLVISKSDNAPGAVYTHLFIRRPDQHREVGDVDFILDEKEYSELKTLYYLAMKLRGWKYLIVPISILLDCLTLILIPFLL